MADEQMVDNLLTFLLAGHETSAKSLAWMLYLSALSPEWEQRLLAQVDERCRRCADRRGACCPADGHCNVYEGGDAFISAHLVAGARRHQGCRP